MKKIIGLFLVIAVVLSTLAITTVAEEAPVKEFLIDGVLDPWYLTNDTTPIDDINTYHFSELDCYVKGGAGTGSSPYEEKETAVEAF